MEKRVNQVKRQGKRGKDGGGCRDHGFENLHEEAICRDNKNAIYSTGWCNVEGCWTEKQKKQKLEQAMYWKNLADEYGVADLKYWWMEYNEKKFRVFIAEHLQELAELFKEKRNK